MKPAPNGDGTGRCSGCGDNTVFEWDPDENEWMSICCWAQVQGKEAPSWMDE